MPASPTADRLARFLCVLLSAGALAVLVIAYPREAPVPFLAIATILIARRMDLKGGLLFISFLSVQALVVFTVIEVGALLIGYDGGRVAVLLATLVVIKEWHRFLDNEYGDGRRGRRVGFALLGIFAAILQVLLA